MSSIYQVRTTRLRTILYEMHNDSDIRNYLSEQRQETTHELAMVPSRVFFGTIQGGRTQRAPDPVPEFHVDRLEAAHPDLPDFRKGAIIEGENSSAFRKLDTSLLG